jgi:hypothetical protein
MAFYSAAAAILYSAIVAAKSGSGAAIPEGAPGSAQRRES